MTTAPPKKKMPWWAGLLIAFGVLALLGLAVVGGVTWWFMSNKDRIVSESKDTMAEAQAYAASHDQNACVDEGLRKVAKCDGFVCEAQTKIFTTMCLQEAQRTPGFCDDVPPPSEIMKTSRWVVAECERRGKPGNQRCSRLVQAVPEVCQSSHRTQR